MKVARLRRSRPPILGAAFFFRGAAQAPQPGAPLQRHYRLTKSIIAEHTAGQVLCLSERGEGLSYQLHEFRPGASLNQRVIADDGAGAMLDEPVENEPVAFVTRVDIRGPIEQRAVEHDSGCGGGWTDGHDAICDRMCAALELGDVVLVVDSPGGSHAGLQEAIKRVLAAKTEHGRHVCVYADEMIGSAAYWWSAAVGDEIYLPESGMVGSIGARAAHVSIAGALEEAGIAVTFFAWPDSGKIAWAEEKPIDDVGRARGDRDVALAGEAFAVAVGAARGLSRDQIVALNADSLTGAAAVAAGLADGVASLDEVLGFALAQAAISAAASGEGNDMATRADNTTKYEKTDDMPPEDMPPEKEKPEEDAEGEEPEKEEPEEDEKRAEDDDDENDTDDSDEPDGDEPPEKEEPKKARKDDRRAAPPPGRMRADASLAEIVGVRKGSSNLAIKTAALRMRAALDACMRETGTKGVDELVGAVKAVAADSRRVSEVEERNAKMLRRSRHERRMVLARKLAAASLPGCTRGDLFVDSVDDSGKRRTRLAPEYQQMRLETFEAFVERKLKNAGPGRPARSSTPFEPSAASAQQGPRAASIEAAKRNPVVIAAAQRTDATIDQCAEAYVAAGLQGNNLVPDNLGL